MDIFEESLARHIKDVKGGLTEQLKYIGRGDMLYLHVAKRRQVLYRLTSIENNLDTLDEMEVRDYIDDVLCQFIQ